MNTSLKNLFTILSAVVLLLIVCPMTTQGQEVPKLKKLKEKALEDVIMPQEKKDLWGYANEKGKFVIKPVFTAAKPFKRGLAIVEYEGKWGVLNRDATFLFPPQFDKVTDFLPYGDGSYSIVTINGLNGVISSSGEVVCAIEYDDVNLGFFEKYGLSVVRKGEKYGFWGVNGSRLKAVYDQVVLVTDGSVDSPEYCLMARIGNKWAVFASDAGNESVPEVVYRYPIVFGQINVYLNDIKDNDEIVGVGIVASESADDGGYANFSVDGKRYPVMSKKMPKYAGASALMKGVDNKVYVIYNSRQYSFMEYNDEMKKDMYARDRVLPEWARVYSTTFCFSEQKPLYEFNYGGQKYQFRYESIKFDSDEIGGIGITDALGKWVLRPVLSNEQPRSMFGFTIFQPDMNGTAIVLKNGKFGRMGNWRYANLPFIFSSYEEAVKYYGQAFDDCYSVITIEADDEGFHKYGYADENGIFIPIQYYCFYYGGEGVAGYDVSGFSKSGYVIVNTEPSDDGKRVIINRQNEIVGPPAGKKVWEYLDELEAKVPIPEAVDLGWSVKWASFNLGASAPEEYGNYYAWGETEPKDDHDWSTYKWSKGEKLTRYNTDKDYGAVDNRTEFKDYGYADDAARANLGGSWRVPTTDECDELIEKCTWEWTSHGGVNGYKVIGPNGNSIFLPAAGNRNYDGLYDEGSCGYYWSSSLYAGYPYGAWGVGFPSGNVYRSIYYRYEGQSVRPVTE